MVSNLFVWIVLTGMNGLTQNVLLNFRLRFPKTDLTIYLPSGISEIFGTSQPKNGTTFSEFPFVPGIFQWDEPKNVYHLHPNRNFREFVVNGKQPWVLDKRERNIHN